MALAVLLTALGISAQTAFGSDAHGLLFVTPEMLARAIESDMTMRKWREMRSTASSGSCTATTFCGNHKGVMGRERRVHQSSALAASISRPRLRRHLIGLESQLMGLIRCSCGV